jgi:hypothetical protein
MAAPGSAELLFRPAYPEHMGSEHRPQRRLGKYLFDRSNARDGLVQSGQPVQVHDAAGVDLLEGVLKPRLNDREAEGRDDAGDLA